MTDQELLASASLVLVAICGAVVSALTLVTVLIVRSYRKSRLEPPIDWRPDTERPLTARPDWLEEEADHGLAPYMPVSEILKTIEEPEENGERANE
jgi:hypothetical protein